MSPHKKLLVCDCKAVVLSTRLNHFEKKKLVVRTKSTTPHPLSPVTITPRPETLVMLVFQQCSLHYDERFDPVNTQLIKRLTSLICWKIALDLISEGKAVFEFETRGFLRTRSPLPRFARILVMLAPPFGCSGSEKSVIFEKFSATSSIVIIFAPG